MACRDGHNKVAGVVATALPRHPVETTTADSKHLHNNHRDNRADIKEVVVKDMEASLEGMAVVVEVVADPLDRFESTSCQRAA